MSRSPTKIDPDPTVAELIRSVKAAGAAGAQLVVFPEAIVPGYPDWVWPLPAWIPISTFDGD